jgi:2-polyprenyl-3-methyl-5-hydroxy-6-metoxy-1,4-benzoquinol methylase
MASRRRAHTRTFMDGELSMHDIEPRLQQIARRYEALSFEVAPGGAQLTLRALMLGDVPRAAFQLGLVLAHTAAGGRVADIGGGLSLFTPAVAEFGFKTLLVDDFSDRWHAAQSQALALHEAAGIEISSRDLLSKDFNLPPAAFDFIGTFDVLEHLHHSPRAMLHELTRGLRPGGWLAIGVPNCVNLRKRLTVPFGVGKWSALRSWYEEPIFRGHVREPDVSDLRYIAADLRLSNVKVLGRNFLGFHSRYPWVRALVPLVDPLLRLRPSLCSNIYLLGQKLA